MSGQYPDNIRTISGESQEKVRTKSGESQDRSKSGQIGQEFRITSKLAQS
jgi:hypothetical protein